MTGTLISSGLPKPPHVKEMFAGADGLLAGMSRGKVWIDHSTTDHQQNKIFTAQLQAKGQTEYRANSPQPTSHRCLSLREFPPGMSNHRGPGGSQERPDGRLGGRQQGSLSRGEAHPDCQLQLGDVHRWTGLSHDS